MAFGPGVATFSTGQIRERSERSGQAIVPLRH